MEKSEPKTPPLVIVNVPPESSLEAKLSVARGGGESLDFTFDLREGQSLGIAQDRDGQPAIGADGDAQVNVLVVDDVVAVDFGIDAREFAQRQHHGAGEEAHEPQANAMHFLKPLLVLGAQGQDAPSSRFR